MIGLLKKAYSKRKEGLKLGLALAENMFGQFQDTPSGTKWK